MRLRDVVDQFHDDNSLAHSSPAKCPDLAALEEWADKVDDFDSGGQHLGRGRLFHQFRSWAMDGIVFLRIHRSSLIHWIAANIKHAPHHTFSDGHGNRLAGVIHFITSLEAFGTGHGDRTNPSITQVLLYLHG